MMNSICSFFFQILKCVEPLPLVLLVSEEKSWSFGFLPIIGEGFFMPQILSRVSLDLDFRSLIMRCLGVDFFGLILFVCVFSHFSRVWLLVTPWTVAHQAPLSMGFSRYYTLYPCNIYNWESVPLKPRHLFHPFPHPFSLWQPLACTLYLWVCFYLFLCFVF